MKVDDREWKLMKVHGKGIQLDEIGWMWMKRVASGCKQMFSLEPNQDASGWKWIKRMQMGKLNESVLKWMKFNESQLVDENGWKWIKVAKSGWQWMKVNKKGWKWIQGINLDESGWMCLNVDESGWK